METQVSLVSEQKRRTRQLQIREQVITLVKCLDTVIHDIKYVVDDLQVLLKQIDIVSKHMDQPTKPRASNGVKLGCRKRNYRCFCSQSPALGKLAKPILLRSKTLSSGSKGVKGSIRLMEYDSSSGSSLGSSDSSVHLYKDNAMEFETTSVQFNTMWDNAFDQDLLVTDCFYKTNKCFDDVVVENKDVLFNITGDTKQLLAKRSSWVNNKIEQSLTSGIDMLSFTDDSDEEYMSSALPIYDTKYGSVPKEFVVSVDPYHVCCKDVIPLGSGHVYCGVYEAMLDACLEPYSCMVERQSFGSDIPLFWGEQDMDDVTAVNYEPTYDRQLNTWTAYTMVALDSIHTSEEELSETALDILNDNIQSSTQINNINSVNTNNPTLYTESDKHHIKTNADGFEIANNTCVVCS